MNKLLVTVLLLFSGACSAQTDELEAEGRACDKGDSLSCFRLGILFNNGAGVTKNLLSAFEYFEKSCDGGNAVGCLYAGKAYGVGRGVTQSDNQALRFYDLACDLELRMGCEEYANLKDADTR